MLFFYKNFQIWNEANGPEDWAELSWTGQAMVCFVGSFLSFLSRKNQNDKPWLIKKSQQKTKASK